MEAKTTAHAEPSARPARRLRSFKKARAAGVAHDIIVIGASMGGVPALMALLKALPADLGAAIFIVQHTGSGAARLPEVLTQKSKLKARYAVHGESIERGRVYVAPPDNHMMIEPGYIHVVRGPRENGHRPAVDPLFRSAARSYGARVVGVLLTGALDCGTNGLMMIKAHGGIAIVQHARRIQRILLGQGLNVPDASKLTARPTSRRLRAHGTPE